MRKNFLCLPYPALLPGTRFEITEAVRTLPDTGTVLGLLRHFSTDFEVAEVAVEPVDRLPYTRARGDEDHAEHDRYFQVRRSSDKPAETFLQGLASIHASVYENGLRMGVDILDGNEWLQIFAGLHAILRYATGNDLAAQDVPVLVPLAPRQTHGDYDPEQRWLIGHQLLFALMQGTIVGLNGFRLATDRGDAVEAATAMRLAAAFMRSSAAAIKFAADFGPVDYQARIRPAMAPPAVQAGFSGLQTRDHTFLVSLFGPLRSAVGHRSAEPDNDVFEDFVDATAMAYEAHALICARFNGAVLPSLRMAAASYGRTTQSGRRRTASDHALPPVRPQRQPGCELTGRTRVGIIGAGPAGMLVATILQRAGVDCVVVERRDRAYVEQRARGGTIEHRVVELLRRHGLADGLLAAGAVEDRIEFRMAGRRYPIQYDPLSAGRTHYIYSQQFLVRDLIEVFLAAGGDLRFETPAQAITDVTGVRPRILLGATPGAGPATLDCEVVVACDGEYGVGRRTIPAETLACYEHRYDYAWLAVLAQAPPSSNCVINAIHESGSCVHVRRTPEISRFYLQCPRQDSTTDWPDERIWKEVRLRLALDEPWTLHEGPILATGMVRMRSLVCAPMQFGSLFLAGDAAHVVPPVGGKGLNIALADAEELALGLIERFSGGNRRRLDTYSDTRLPQIWRIQEFVHWMMDLVNTPGLGTATAPFLHRVQMARLERLLASTPYAAAFLQDYIGWES